MEVAVDSITGATVGVEEIGARDEHPTKKISINEFVNLNM
jgi:hypothetical protein